VSNMVISLVLAAAAAANGPLVVGVLEEPQCQPEKGRSVRVLFTKQDSEWRALAERNPIIDSLAHEWTIAFDGKSLGPLKTKDPGWRSEWSSTYARDRLLAVEGNPPPSVANRQKLFEGWCDAPTHRPLVVVSRPNFKDPDVWKPQPSTRADRDRVFAAFQAHAGKVMTCPTDPEKWVPLRYSANDLVVRRHYKDSHGRHLIGVKLNSRLNTCDGPPDVAWWETWFLVSNRVVHLGQGLSLVDAGDYDDDGHSELLFWYSGYNNDGYVLFESSLARRVDYLWNYH
jgi:hypothetical protein